MDRWRRASRRGSTRCAHGATGPPYRGRARHTSRARHRSRTARAKKAQSYLASGRRPDWFPQWAGATCVIVGGGPSVKLVQQHFAEARETSQGLRWIAVNNAYQLIPWADALYACDGKWWKQHSGAKHFRGLKITQSLEIIKKWPDVKKIFCRKGCNDLLFDAPGEVGWAGNGGFHALNLAIQFGARRIVLVGFDMSVDHGHHWHGSHPKGMNNPSKNLTEAWRIRLDGQKPLLDRMGISVVIGSPNSRLMAYPKLAFLEAIASVENSRQSSPG